MADSLDPQLLQELINQLIDVNRSLRAVGNSDRIISAIAKLNVTLQQKTQTMAQEQAAMQNFAKNVDQAAERMKANRDAQEKLRTEAQRTEAALNNLGQQAANTGQKLNDQARIASIGEKMRADRREQWREKEITSAGQLISEYEKGAGVTQILRDRLETVGGTSMTLNVSARLAAAALEGLGKASVGYIKAMYAGEQGAMVAAKAVTTFADQISTAATVIGTALMFIPGLGIASRIAGGAISLLGVGAKVAAKATELAAEQSDRMYDSFVTLSKAGVTGSDGMMGLAESAQRLGYGLDQVSIQAFNALMTEASRDISMMAGSAAEGRRRFAQFSGEIVKSDLGRHLMTLGFSVDDINNGVAGFVKQQVSLGLIQNKSNKELRDGAHQYLLQMDALTKLTGIQRRELETQMDNNRRNERFRAAIEKVRQQQGPTAAKNLEYNMAVVSERFPELSKGLQDIAAGFVDTEDAQKVFRAGMADIPGLMTRGLGSGFQELAQAARRTTDSMGSLAEVGAFGPVFGSYYEQLKVAGMSEEDAAKRALEIQAEQKKGGDAAVKSQVDLRRSQMDTRDALQSLVRDGITPATKALRKLAGLPEEITEALSAKRAAGGEFANEFNVDGTMAAPPVIVPEGPMERNAVTDAARGAGSVLQGMGLGPTVGQSPKTESRVPRAPPAPPPRPGFEQSHETLKKLGLRIKEGDVQQEGKRVSPKILKIAQEVQGSVPDFRYFSGFNDKFHNENVPSSFHTLGQALDFTVNQRPTPEQGTKIIQMLKAMGADYARDEYNNPSSNSTAGHFHAHVREFARGGISRGPSTGYAATLHGTEAVVPLPDGRAIPVKIELPEIRNPFADMAEPTSTPDMEAAVDRMSQQIRTAMEEMMRAYRSNPAMESALQELVSLQRSNNSTAERLLQVSVN